MTAGLQRATLRDIVTLAEPYIDVSTHAPEPSDARPEPRAAPAPVSTARLPGQDELPYSDGEPLESEHHVLGMNLLISSLKPWLRRQSWPDGTTGGHVAGNMFLYFSPEQVKGRHVRGPDCMVTLGAEPTLRKSWVVWEEGKAPDLIIELLSDTTRNIDKLSKPRIYRDEVGVREYYWFDPRNPEQFAGFAFSPGERTSPAQARGTSDENPGADADPLEPNLEPDRDGRITSELLGLRLGPWRGRHEGADGIWLRWFTLDGELLLPEADLRADHEARRADHEALRADHEALRADQLASKLRELGIDPDQIL